jgi:hypothetical protein
VGKAKTYSIRKPLKRFERSFDPAGPDPETLLPEPEIIVQTNITVNPGEKGPAGLTRTGRAQDTGGEPLQEGLVATATPAETRPGKLALPAIKKVRKKKPRRRGKLEQ